jgi:hypothetical protein
MSIMRLVGVVVGLVLAWSALLPVDVLAQSGCRRTRGNLLGVDRAPVVVSDSVVTVAEANGSRCSLAIINVSQNDASCADTSIDPAPTASTGILIKGNGNGIALGTESTGMWRCVRTGGADAVLNVIEGMP